MSDDKFNSDIGFDNDDGPDIMKGSDASDATCF